MDSKSTITLNNGVNMPLLGLGVFRTPPGEMCRSVVRCALEHGYTMLDTARIYCNEKSVGRGIKDVAIKRDEVFVTTKLWKDGFDNPQEALEASLERLGLDYVDLYLIHWPFTHYERVYLTLEKLQSQGLCRAIGVSNFKIHHLERLKSYGAQTIPQVNQVECHPQNSEEELLNYCRKHNILLEAYSPLGGKDHSLVNDERIKAIAKNLNVSAAQVILRWNLQRQVAIIPKSIHAERIYQNAQIYNFSLSDEDMAMINSMNANLRRAYDADKINERPQSTFPPIIEEE